MEIGSSLVIGVIQALRNVVHGGDNDITELPANSSGGSSLANLYHGDLSNVSISIELLSKFLVYESVQVHELSTSATAKQAVAATTPVLSPEGLSSRFVSTTASVPLNWDNSPSIRVHECFVAMLL